MWPHVCILSVVLILLVTSFFTVCRKLSFDRLHFVLDNAIGKPLGSIFEVKGSKLHKISEEDDLDDLLNVQTDQGQGEVNVGFLLNVLLDS